MENAALTVHRLWRAGALGILSFAAVVAFAATAGALAIGQLTVGVSALSVALGLAAAVGTVHAESRREDEPAAGDVRTSFLLRPTTWAAGLLAAVALRQFLFLAVSDGSVVTQPNPYNYGDLPLHWTYVAYLSEGTSFWPENPIFTGRRLSYPIGSDLLAAVLVKLGLALPPVLRFTGLLASFALLVGLLRWGGPFAVLALLVSGGFALDRLAPGALLRASDPDLPWKNVFLALFVPQRGFLYALPAGLLLLESAREKLLRHRPGLPALLEGLLWGALPLFHVHTFLVVSLVFGAWALAGRSVRAALPSLGIAFLLATPSVHWVTDGFSAARMIWWKPGWMIDGSNPVAFLLVNFGLLLPLAAWVLVRPPRAEETESRIVLGTALGLFVGLFFVMLAPWEWDNTKALVWAFLLMLGPLGAWLGQQGRRLRAALVVLLVAPGVPALVGSFAAPGELVAFDEKEKAAVCEALQAVPANARVATAQTFNHPVALCGRGIVAGYGGHLWTHGIPAAMVEERLRTLMMGWPGWADEARALGATHLFWGFREEREFPGTARLWAKDRPPLRRGVWGALYVLTD